LGFREIDHQADLAFEIYGKNENELLESIISLFKEIFKIEKFEDKVAKREIFTYETFEDLIFELGNELIYLFTTHNLFPKELKLDVSKKELKVKFSKAFSKNSEEIVEVKALTYHKLKLNRSKGLLWTYLVLDV